MKLLIAFALICTICVLTVQGAPKWGEDHEHEEGERPHHHHRWGHGHHHHHGRHHHHSHGDCSTHKHAPAPDNSSEEKGEGKDKSVSSESTEHQGTLDARTLNNGGVGGGEIDSNNKPLEDASQLSSSSTTASLEPHALFEEGSLSPVAQQTDQISQLSNSNTATLEPHALFFEEGNLSPVAQQTDQLNDINGFEQSVGAGELNTQPNTLTGEVLQGSAGAGAGDGDVAGDDDVDLRSG